MSLVRDLLRPFDTLAEPTEVFGNLKVDPKWIVPFLTISILWVFQSVAIVPFTNQLRITMMAAAGLEQDQELWKIGTSELFRLALQPVFLLMRVAILSASLFFLLILFGATEPKGKAIFAVVLHSETILLMMGVLNVVVLYLRGFEVVLDPTDLLAIPGLDLLLHERRAVTSMTYFLNTFNPFAIWYLMVLSLGLSIVCGVKRVKALVACSIMWIVQGGLFSGMLRLLGPS